MNVVILDSGINESTYIKAESTKSFFRDGSTADFSGHGTNVAAIIGCSDPCDLGVAPRCRIHVGKVFGERGADWPAIIQGLDWAIQQKPDVLNLSWAFPQDRQGVRERLEAITAAGTLVLAASGGRLRFPGHYPCVIEVGETGARSSGDILTVSKVIKRSFGPRPFRGTSVSTAVMSGIAACARAVEPGLSKTSFLSLMRSLVRG